MSKISSDLATEQQQAISSAISDIVHYQTLPSQIDYTAPYKAKAEKATDYLLSLPNGQKYIDRADKQVFSYYDSPAAYLDEMF